MDCLGSLWNDINRRKQADVNALNYSAAWVAGAKYTKPGDKVKVSDYLPYNLESQAGMIKEVSPALANEIYRLDLPPGMLRDLIMSKAIKPRETS